MCVIFACYEKFPSEQMLEKGANQNRDGAGVAWIDKQTSRVRWVKGLPSDPKAVLEVLKKAKAIPALIHFRVASVGGPLKELTHPFVIDPISPLALEGVTDRVLMHNGHWNSWRETTRDYCLKHNVKPPQGAMSDSRAMAFLAAKLGIAILPLLDSTDRIIVLHKESKWNYWGHWVEAEKHAGGKESGYLLSRELWGGSGTSSRSHKSSEPEHVDDSDEAFFNHPAWWDPSATQDEEGGKDKKKDGQAPPKGSPSLGGPSSPLALGPGAGPTTETGKTSSEPSSTNSRATSAPGSSATARDARTRETVSSGMAIDADLVTEGKAWTPNGLEGMLSHIRTQLGMGKTEGH